MLVHLQSFDTVPEHFTIPESNKNGVPLFYIPPDSITLVHHLVLSREPWEQLVAEWHSFYRDNGKPPEECKSIENCGLGMAGHKTPSATLSFNAAHKTIV
ncbi:Protein SZT2 [Chelonia mydas]|uniref:Protein SZT2 n=1 Tax=Chelonia mydas TaxID=8469 RepID=M7BP78_CHEMY|nr:Protein SZT2 [Chelonia mydas]